MKKIIMLLCFAVSAGLVASDWMPLKAGMNSSNWVYQNVGKLKVLLPIKALCDKSYDHCLEPDKNGYISANLMRDRFGLTLQEYFLAGRESVAATKIQKFGYVCVGALAVYGAVQLVFAIKNKFKAIKNDN
jgi:hypothetical protein